MREKLTAGTLKEGFNAAWPICVGYFPLGLAFGILAQKAGLRPHEIGFMSVAVFAGSAQFIAVSMLHSSAAVFSIVATAFVVNLRHVLMSSALAVHLRDCSPSFLSLFAYGVTDESFAVNMAKFREGGWHGPSALVVNHVANVAWVGSSILGAFAGEFIPEGSLGIDYAMTAMFLCLVVFQLRGRVYVFTALASGGIALGVSLWLPGNIYVIVASLTAATAGFALRRKLRRGGAGAL